LVDGDAISNATDVGLVVTNRTSVATNADCVAANRGLNATDDERPGALPTLGPAALITSRRSRGLLVRSDQATSTKTSGDAGGNGVGRERSGEHIRRRHRRTVTKVEIFPTP
jgi:hypothetical protein